MEKPTRDSLYLLEEPATPQIIDRLYQQQFIDQSGKECGLHLLQPQTRRYWFHHLIKWIGIGLIVAGFILLFAQKWQTLSPRYQQICLLAAVLLCIYGNFVYLSKYYISQSWLAAAILFTCLNLIYLLHMPHKTNLFYALSALLIGLILAFCFKVVNHEKV